MNVTKTFKFGIFCEEELFGAINIDNIAYLTTAKSKKQLLKNIEEVIQLLEGEKTAEISEDDFTKYCCYWLIEYNPETKKVRLISEEKDLLALTGAK